MSRLKKLVQHRNALLLAEALGWVHDYRKCSDEILQGGGLPRNELLRKVPDLSGVSLSLPSPFFSESIENLLNQWKGKFSVPNTSPLLQYLSRCHNTAHYDKQEPVGGNPDYPVVQVSTPFGFDSDIPIDLTKQLWNLPWQDLASYSSTQRDSLLKCTENLFSKTIADTRRPINEVDLWSWGLLVGALYKAALASALLSGSAVAANDLRWRLLGIRINGIDFFLNVTGIPDLLAKRDLLTDCFNNVRNLLEVVYPLGSEVYRDENGSIYVVPDIPDLLKVTNNDGNSLRDLILQAFAEGMVKNKPNLSLGGELVPHIELERKAWWGQDPNWPKSSKDELPDISGFLAREFCSTADASKVGEYWKGGQALEICSVCGLRPQGPGKKAVDRNVCDICEERRADRSQSWATSQADRTIWTDEVADTNGRLVLIVGKFDLTHWLDGTFLETLLLIAPHDPENTAGKPVTSKTPSFSRLRRIWRTTYTFWSEIKEEFLKQLTDDRRRLKIQLNGSPNLGPFHVYDLLTGPTDLSVVWVPPQGSNSGYFISADNLGYIARQLGSDKSIYTDPVTAAIFVEEYLVDQFVKKSRQPVLRNPDIATGQGRKNLLEGLNVTKVDYQSNSYATAVPILYEPRSFMIIVPADKSMELIEDIKNKYEHEMGKVRNRLPLHLGCVYASRRTPIRALLDAGRSMLGYKTRPEQWTVLNNILAPNSDKVILELERIDHQIQWDVPVKMGDGTTMDRWYPYFFLEIGGDDAKADANNRRAVKVAWPTKSGQPEEKWIVHASDLKVGEQIYLWPSTFDFEFLDVTSRRFELHYDAEGKRTGNPRRPYLLDELDLWGRIKTHLAFLEKQQIYHLVHTIEATAELWGLEEKSRKDGTFRQFVADTLATAAWPKGHKWDSIPEEDMELMVDAGVSGMLKDLVELHFQILKTRFSTVNPT